MDYTSGSVFECVMSVSFILIIMGEINFVCVFWKKGEGLIWAYIWTE